MRKIFFIILFLFIFHTNEIIGKNNPNPASDTSDFEIILALKRMEVSMHGTTAEGHSYSMYAIATKKNWIFLIRDSIGVYSIKFDKPGNQLVETGENFTEIIYLSVKSNSLKKIEKTNIIEGTTIQCYYKMKRKISKMYASAKKMDKKISMVSNDIRKGYNRIKSDHFKIKSIRKKNKNE